MTDEPRGEREERAFEALVVSAFCRMEIEDVDVQEFQQLTAKEEAVIASLDPDFMKRLIAGDVDATSEEREQCIDSDDLVAAGESHGFLNRASQVDETAEEEVRKKRQLIRERKRSERARDKKNTHG